MQIYVCVKHVPDTAANIKLVGDKGFDDAGCKFIANPYDEYAIEQAVQLVEKNGGEVIIVTVGKAAAAATICLVASWKGWRPKTWSAACRMCSRRSARSRSLRVAMVPVIPRLRPRPTWRPGGRTSSVRAGLSTRLATTSSAPTSLAAATARPGP